MGIPIQDLVHNLCGNYLSQNTEADIAKSKKFSRIGQDSVARKDLFII